jgi:hypothetical protein
MQEKSGGGIITLILIGLAIWFFFFRVDYKDVWWKDTEYQTVRYCGMVGEADCQAAKVNYLPITHEERSGDIHSFQINFDNGGYVEVEGSCMKDSSNLYGVERYCYTTTVSPNESGRYQVFLITKV